MLPWWKIELEGELAEGPGVERTWEAATLENTFQLTEPGKYFFNLGLFVDYSRSTVRPVPTRSPSGRSFKGAEQRSRRRQPPYFECVLLARCWSRLHECNGISVCLAVPAAANYHIDPAIEFVRMVRSDLTHAGPFSSQQHFVGPALVGAWSSPHWASSNMR